MTVNKKLVPILMVLALAVLVFVLKQCKQGSGAGTKTGSGTSTRTTAPGEPSRERGFDRRTSYLEYSNHAKCRMDCRHTTQAEVAAIMKDGKINYKKSDLQNTRCPRYAVEGTTHDDQRVRIVFAQCNESTTVVTVIDLGTEWQCDCPGDDKKYQNRN